MRFTIKNYRRIQKASFDLGDITIVGARNNNGKTSLLQGVIEALNGAKPYPSMTKADEQHIVHSGQTDATIEYSDGQSYGVIHYPGHEVTVKGRFPSLDDYSAGQTGFLCMNPKKRLSEISEIYDTIPTREELLSALTEKDDHGGMVTVISEKSFDAMWEKLEMNSWDLVHDDYRQKITKLKGQWEMVAHGERYGVKKAAQWKPEGWEFDLSTMHIGELEDAVKKAQEWLDGAEKHKAITESESDNLKLEAEKVSHLEEAVKLGIETVTEIEDKRNALTKKIRALPPLDSLDAQSCPDCGKPLSVLDGKIVVHSVTSAEAKKIRTEHKKLSEEMVELTQSRDEWQKTLNDNRLLLKSAKDAEKRLSESEIKSEDSAKEYEKVRQDLEREKNRLDMKKRVQDASELADRIVNGNKVVSALAPNGLRMKKAEQAIFALNAKVFEIAEKIGWNKPKISLSGEIETIVPAKYLGRSERFKVDLLFNIAIAHKKKSPMIIIDEADTLDKKGVNSLLNYLVKIRGEIKSIVAMSVASIKEMPSCDGIIKAVWVEDGIVV